MVHGVRDVDVALEAELHVLGTVEEGLIGRPVPVAALALARGGGHGPVGAEHDAHLVVVAVRHKEVACVVRRDSRGSAELRLPCLAVTIPSLARAADGRHNAVGNLSDAVVACQSSLGSTQEFLSYGANVKTKEHKTMECLSP